MPAFPRTLLPFEVTSLDLPGPLISKAQSGRVNIRTTQQVGRSWQERYLVNVRSVDGRALLAAVDDYWRNGTIFTIDHRDHLTPLGTLGGSPLINQPAQLVSDPENFGNWTIQDGTPGRTSGQADPFGGTAAYLLDDNDGASLERIFQPVTFTADGEKCVALFIRQGTSGANLIWLYDATAATTRHAVTVTWSGGVPTLSTAGGGGTRFAPFAVAGGWWLVAFSATGVVAANSNRIIIDATNNVAAQTGTAYIFGANAWNSSVPAGYIGPSHTTATGNRLYVDGATASIANWLRAGDIVKVAGLNPTYEVTANVNSEAGGYASIPINPPIFAGGAPGDNAVVTITGITLTACILEPPAWPTTSGASNDYGELRVSFSEVG